MAGKNIVEEDDGVMAEASVQQQNDNRIQTHEEEEGPRISEDIFDCISQLKPFLGTLQNVRLEIALVGMIDKVENAMDYLKDIEESTRKKKDNNNNNKRILQLDDDDEDRKRLRKMV